jgi:class 3 adenylate cyclase
MNVAARLCEYAKLAKHRLVVSGESRNRVTMPAGLEVGERESIALRGRQQPIDTHAVNECAFVPSLA